MYTMALKDQNERHALSRASRTGHPSSGRVQTLEEDSPPPYSSVFPEYTEGTVGTHIANEQRTRIPNQLWPPEVRLQVHDVEDSENRNPETTEGELIDPETPCGYVFSDESIRKRFIFKIFMVLILQFLIMTLIVGLCTIIENLQWGTRYFSPFIYTFIFILLPVKATLASIEARPRPFPLNLIIFTFVTIILSYFVGVGASYLSSSTVAISLGTILAVFLGWVILALLCFDFTKPRMLYIGFGIILLYYGMIAAIVPFSKSVLYAALAATVYLMKVVDNTSNILGGSNLHVTSPEEYVVAAIAVFSDFLCVILIVTVSVYIVY